MFKYFFIAMLSIYPLNAFADNVVFNPTPEIYLSSGERFYPDTNGHHTHVTLKFAGLPDVTAEIMQSESGTVVLTGLVSDKFSARSVLWHGGNNINGLKVDGISYDDKLGTKFLAGKVSVREIIGSMLKNVELLNTEVTLLADKNIVSINAEKIAVDGFDASSSLLAGGMHSVNLRGITLSRDAKTILSTSEVATELEGSFGESSNTLRVMMRGISKEGSGSSDITFRLSALDKQLIAEMSSRFLNLNALVKLTGVDMPLNSSIQQWAASISAIQPTYAKLSLKDTDSIITAGGGNLMLTVPSFLASLGFPGVIRSAVVKWLEKPSSQLIVEGLPEGNAMHWSANTVN